MLNLLEHMNDSAAAVPRRQLSKLLYGGDSVFARSPTPDQVRWGLNPETLIPLVLSKPSTFVCARPLHTQKSLNF